MLALWLYYGVFRGRLLVIGPVVGLVIGVGVLALVVRVAPWARYKKDVGLEGPGCVYTYSEMVVPFVGVNGLVVGAYWLAT